MIVLDENIPEDQRLLLRSWRTRAYQVGRDVGRAGIKDEQIIPLLLKLRRPIFFTRNLGFFDLGSISTSQHALHKSTRPAHLIGVMTMRSRPDIARPLWLDSQLPARSLCGWLVTGRLELS